MKAGRDPAAGSSQNLASLAERSPRLKRQIVVFLGPRRQRIGRVEALPLLDFLGELPA